MRKIFIISLLLSALAILIGLSSSFFQQDEWHTFGTLQAYGSLNYLVSGFNFFDLVFFGRIGSRLIMMLLFYLFHTNGIAFGLFSGFFHILNSILVFMVAFQFTKNKNISYLASLFFLINSVADQSYLWFGTMAGTLPSMTFSLLATILYLKFIKIKDYRLLLFSIFMLFISFLFKENGYVLFLAFPAIWFLYSKKKSLSLFFKDNLLVVIFGLLNSFIYLKYFISIPGDRVNYIAPQTQSGALNLLSHLIFYPFEGFSQIFIPSSLTFGLSSKITKIFFPYIPPGTPDFDLFYTTKVANYVSIVTSILLVIFLLFMYKKYRKNIDSLSIKVLLISISLTVLSFIPVTVLSASNAYLDSRYYYPSLLGASILFGMVALIIVNNVQGVYKKLALVAITILLGLHVLNLGTDLMDQVKVSQERINIIETITRTVPQLKNKTVFYISGDSGGYYALPELKVPFQSGLGEVLMVVYNDTGIFPLLKDNPSQKDFNAIFLYDTLAQGYKEKNGRGFGYFTDKNELKKTIRKYNIDTSKSLFAFYYKSDSKVLLNITSDFRKEMGNKLND